MKKILITFIMLIALISVSTSPVYALGDIVGPDVIYKENNEIVSVSDITSLYSASGGAIIVEEDGFTGYGHIPGEKTIKLKATDGLVEKFKEVKIVITYNKIPDDGAENLFKLIGKSSDSYVFVTTITKTVTVEKLRDAFINLGLLSIVEPSSKSIILDEYTENKDETGNYSLNFRIMDATGNVKTFYTQIRVLGASGEWEVLTPSEPGFTIDFSFISVGFSVILSIAIILGLIVVVVKIKQRFDRKVKKGG